MKIRKYPRTRHVEGSRLQHGDGVDDCPFSSLKGKQLVIEEKLDGANSAISFPDGELRLQSRGYYLTGGYRERHFAMLKTWAACHEPTLKSVLGQRYIMYGEWMFAKHTVFYDALPHYFMEFDILDLESDVFLSTSARRALLGGMPIMPVPILHTGQIDSYAKLISYVQGSLYKTANWRNGLGEAIVKSQSRVDLVTQQTEDSDFAEGLYIKVEANGSVRERYKYVRLDFVQAILDSDSHWHDRPIVQNFLVAGVDIFASSLGLKGAYDE